MKTSHILILLILVTIIAVVVSTLTHSGTYADFSEAALKSSRDFQIIGILDKNKPIEYNPGKNANQFSFYMKDEKGIEKKVVYNDAKPHDFEKSEKIVVTGHMEKDYFQAKSLLLKCPSKYNTEKKPEKFRDKSFQSNP
ncbi:MAG: cytochrome c maturation protein CcmE [Bacteroidota bacterium]|nr:cytochrome c maturation protein CcmE [Bacteroidota bacterium]